MNHVALDIKFLRNLLCYLGEISPYQFYLDRKAGKKGFDVYIAGSLISVENVDSALVSLIFGANRLHLGSDIRRFIQNYRDNKGRMLALSDISSLERLIRISESKEKRNYDIEAPPQKLVRVNHSKKGIYRHHSSHRRMQKRAATPASTSGSSAANFDALERQLGDALNRLG